MEHLVTATKHISIMKEVLAKEAQAIAKLVDNVDSDMASIVEMFLFCKGRVIVTGVGKSGIIGRKIAATLASTGTPSLFLHPAEGLHGDLGMVTERDIVLALSNSGESDEVIHIIPSIKKIKAKLVAFVGNENSTLAKQADKIISIGIVKEACPFNMVPTTSTTLMLALGDAIAISLLTARKFSLEEFAVFHPGGSLGRRLLFTVNSIIELSKRNPLVRDNCTIKDALFNMTDSGVGATSVTNHHGKLIGIITDGDIRRALAKGEDMLNISIENFYNQEPISIRPTVLAFEALNIMQQNKINVLPVVNHLNKPIGMVHLQDILRLGF